MGASKIRLETLVDLVEHRCAASPDATVYTLLDDGVEADRLTCRHLWQRTREVAAGLQQSTTPGERVLLLYPTGLEFVVALFGSAAAELVAVPAPPPDLNRLQRTLPRLMSMIRDSEPTLVLAAPAVIRGLRQLVAETPELAALRWRSLSEVEAAAGDWKRPELAADSLAYLQYTSGSTASPKGVMVSHANLLHNSRSIRDAWRYGPDSIDVSWVPHFHDDGLVHGIVQPLFCGGRSYLMDPMSFVGRPARWLEAISRFRATHSGGPDFAYVLAARKVTKAQRAELDLSSWRLAYNAAEPVRSETLEAFSKAFEPQGFDRRAFFPSFGMAETTLLVSTARWDMPPTTLAIDPAALERDQRVVPETGGRTFVGCGLPVQETDIVIARPETCERCGPDEVGEVWIRGGGVASGYWRNPEATEEAFGGRLSGAPQSGDLQSGDEQSGNGQSVRYLRTGDLGFLRDGELFITGRRKDLIIIRGRNLYPQDIESTAVASHPALRPGCGAAFGVEAGGEERLVVVQEASDRAPLDIDDLAQTVRRKL
ncbi:MAG: fatty acyl-AMP ligase, partial [Acidobacteriota bacterium]